MRAATGSKLQILKNRLDVAGFLSCTHKPCCYVGYYSRRRIDQIQTSSKLRIADFCCVLRVHGACFDMYTMSVSVNFHDVCLCLYMMFATVHDFGFCLHPCEILCVPLDSVTQPVLTQFVSMQILSIKKKRNSPCVCTCVSVSLFVSLSVSEFY